MKPKTARRYLSRNKHKIKKRELQRAKQRAWLGIRFAPDTYVRKCLKALRKDIRENKNPASIRAYNNFMYP